MALAALAFPAPVASATPPGFITRSGTQFLIDGAPFRFTGINIYNAQSDGWCGPPMRFGSTLDDALTSIGPGKKVLRTWFFQGSAIDWDTNQRDWSAFDHTLQVADAHGMKVVATLTDEWGECGTHVGGSPENGIKYEPWSGKPGHARSRQLRGAERAVPDDPRSPRDRHV